MYERFLRPLRRNTSGITQNADRPGSIMVRARDSQFPVAGSNLAGVGSNPRSVGSNLVVACSNPGGLGSR